MSKARIAAYSLVLSVLLATTAAVAVEPAAPAPGAEELLKSAMRFPVTTVPLVGQAPNVDGQVEEAEWSGASLLPDMMTLDARRHEGSATRYRTRVWLAYTAEALYVAMRADYPDWVDQPLAISTQRDQSSGNESHFDLFINPTQALEHGELWHLCGNPKGALFDRHLTDASLAIKWSPDVTYRARVLPQGWEGEYKVPFAALGLAAPQPGQYWRANFFFIRMRPGRIQSTWSPWIEWRQRLGGSGYGWLRFGTDATAVRFEKGFDLADRQGPVIALVGPAGAEVQTRVELLRRTDTIAPEQPTMSMNLAKWYAERNVGGAAFLGMSLDKIIEEVLKRFAPLGQPVERSMQAGGENAVVSLPATPELGEYMVRYQFVRPGSSGPEILAAGAVSYRVKPQLAIDLQPMFLKAKLVEATVDYSNLVELDKAKQLQLVVRPESGSTAVFEQAKAIEGTEPIVLQIPDEKLKVGSYTVEAQVSDASNKKLASITAPLVRPETPAWWSNPVGQEPLVPAPWTPVQVQKSEQGVTVSMWGREYRFAGLPVPLGVKTTPARYSTGEPAQTPVDLLHGPMALQLRTASAAAQPNTAGATLAAEPIEVVQSTPEKTVLRSVNRAGNVEIKGTTTVEFDGMIRVDLEIAPREGKATIDSLDFVIPFKSEYAKLLGNFRPAPGPGKMAPRQLGFLPKLPWSNPVNYAQTIGTDRLGLQWFCDSTRDWRLNKPDQAMEVRQAGPSVEEVFHLIDYPVELDRPLRITFGLMALPVKPLPEGWGRIRINSASYATPPDSEPQKLAAYKQLLSFYGCGVELAHNPGWSGTPWYPYYFQDKVQQQEFKRHVDLKHELGIRYAPHSGWQAISTLIPEWPSLAKEMGIAPETETLGKTVFACYNSPYSEFTAYLWDHHARTVGIDGIKADTMFPQTVCASLHHGCGWYDQKGNLWPSVNLFATRDCFKRLYRIFHGGVRQNGFTNSAQTGAPIAAICSFTDIVNISEGTPYHKATSIKEGYPQDLVRTLMVGAPYGVITIHDMKGEPLNAGERVAALLVAGADPRFMGSPGQYLPNYATLPPGTFTIAAPFMELWAANDWIDRGGKALWMPYWENEKVLTLTAPKIAGGATAEMYASLYVQPGNRILLIVTNYETQPVTAKVALNLAGLGFAGSAKLQAEDAVTHAPVAVQNGALDVGVISERYRVIKLWVGEAPQYAEDRLGENLLTGGDFENWEKPALRVTQPPAQKQPGAMRDTQAFQGHSSLRLIKTGDTPNGSDSVNVQLASVTLPPGEYVVQGRLRVDENFGVATDQRVPRIANATAGAYVQGQGLEFLPPAFASNYTGRFFVEEKTPGWEHVVIGFKVSGAAQPVSVLLTLSGTGSAWFDDFTLRRVGK